jgi:hypothetical protein
MKVHDKQRLALYQMAAADLEIQSDKVEVDSPSTSPTQGRKHTLGWATTQSLREERN